MKKLFYALSLLLSVSLLFSQTKLISYSVNNFGEISRVSLTFNQKTSYSYRKEANNQRLVISLAEAKNLTSKSKNYGLNTVSSINVQTLGNQLSIYIKTANVFSEVKESSSNNKNYTLHYDIFNSSSPNNFNELLSYAKYYKFLGNKEKYLNYYKKAKELDPKNPKLNEKSTQISSKTSKPTKKSINKNKVKKAEPNKTKIKVLKKSEDKSALKPESKPTQNNKTVTPITENKITEVKTTPSTSPVKSDSIKIKPVIMNNKMRMPITRPDLLPKKIVKKTVIDSSVVKKDSVQTNKLVDIKSDKILKKQETPKLEEKPVVDIPVIKSDNLKEQLILDLFKSVETDSSRQDLILGVVASYTGANKEAMKSFKNIPQNNILKTEANKYLYEVYQRMGKDYVSEAKLLYAEINPDSSINKKPSSLLEMNIKLWMALIFSAFILILTIAVMLIINHAKNKKNQPKISESDFELHKNHLQRAYENKTILDDTMETSDKTESTDYDNPPIISENLEPEEEIELEEDEDANYITIMTKDKKPNDEFDDENEGFADEEYKKKMILKLYNDGWAIEEIAKELQISQREIEFIIKMSE